MRRSITVAIAACIVGLVACERSPDARGVNADVPQSTDGRRTSVPGKVMDRAEDLKRQVDAYNQTIDDTIAQGTSDAPPKRKAPKEVPPSQPSETP